MTNIEKNIKQWLKSIITDENYPVKIIDPAFTIEDGMSLTEYWAYEKREFKRLARFFDMDQNFSIEIMSKISLSKDKDIYFIWVFNHLNILAFKFNLTLNKQNLISSNGYRSQQAIKCTINHNKITDIKMIIRGQHVIKNIISANLQLEGIYKTETTVVDGFYLAQFVADDIQSLVDKQISFFLLYEDGVKCKIEMILDNYQPKYKPYLIEQGMFKVIAETYPVNLIIYKEDNSFEIIENPRDFIIPVNEINNIIITDVLDNDWIQSFI